METLSVDCFPNIVQIFYLQAANSDVLFIAQTEADDVEHPKFVVLTV